MLEDKVEEYERRKKEIDRNTLGILMGTTAFCGIVSGIISYFFSRNKLVCFPSFIIGGFFGTILGSIFAEKYCINQYKKLDNSYRLDQRKFYHNFHN
jgi:ammonia channel protein AmtB